MAEGADVQSGLAVGSPPPDTLGGMVGMNDYSSAVKDLTSLKRQEVAATDKVADQTLGQLSADQALVEQTRKNAAFDPNLVKPWNAEAESAKRRTDPLEAFGSFGSVFGILASLFTHAPMTNALNASAAAMNAVKEGNELDYQKAYKAWQDNTKLAMENHKIQHEAYTDAVALMRTNLAAGEAKLRVLANRFGDQQTLKLLENGLSQEAIKLMDGRNRLAVGIEESNLKIEEDHAKLSRLWSSEDEEGRKYDPKNKEAPQNAALFKKWEKENIELKRAEHSAGQGTLEGQERQRTYQRAKEEAIIANGGKPLTADKERELQNKFLSKNTSTDALFPDETVKTMAEQYLAGDKSVMQNLGRGAQGAENISKLRAEIARQAREKNMNGQDIALRLAEFNGLTAGQRALGTRTANIEMFASETMNMIQVARQASKDVPRTEWIPANRALQSFEKNTGSPQIRAFGAALNSLVNVYAKAIAGGGQATVSDKDHAREIITTADSEAQFEAVMQIIEKEIAAARAAPGQVKQQFRDLATDKKLDENLAPTQNLIRYDKEGNRIK